MAFAGPARADRSVPQEKKKAGALGRTGFPTSLTVIEPLL
jgi:hypothetical protein